MTDIITPADLSDPQVQNRIRKNERVADECLSLMVKRYRKKPPEDIFEDTVNTVGILCAVLIRDANDMGGEKLAQAMSELFNHHIDRALALLDVKGGPQ